MISFLINNHTHLRTFRTGVIKYIFLSTYIKVTWFFRNSEHEIFIYSFITKKLYSATSWDSISLSISSSTFHSSIMLSFLIGQKHPSYPFVQLFNFTVTTYNWRDWISNTCCYPRSFQTMNIFFNLNLPADSTLTSSSCRHFSDVLGSQSSCISLPHKDAHRN